MCMLRSMDKVTRKGRSNNKRIREKSKERLIKKKNKGIPFLACAQNTESNPCMKSFKCCKYKKLGEGRLIKDVDQTFKVVRGGEVTV